MKKLLLFSSVLFFIFSFTGCSKDKPNIKNLILGKWNYVKLQTLQNGTITDTDKSGSYEFFNDGTVHIIDGNIDITAHWVLSAEDSSLTFDFAPTVSCKIFQIDKENFIYYAEVVSFGNTIRNTFYLTKPNTAP